jgi:hypothetical protein
MADLLRVSIFGQMPGGEEWSVNPVFSVGGDFGTPVSPQQAQTIATAIAAIAVPTGLMNLMSNSTNVQGVRVEARSLAGVLESQGEALKGIATPGGQTVGHPFQTAVVLSLRSGTPGASGRGRLYWPGTGAPLNIADLRIVTGTVSSALSGAKTYLSGIETAIEATLTGVSLCVWSRKLVNLFPVTQLQIGNVADVQRRRRDALVEGYQATTYP